VGIFTGTSTSVPNTYTKRKNDGGVANLFDLPIDKGGCTDLYHDNSVLITPFNNNLTDYSIQSNSLTNAGAVTFTTSNINASTGYSHSANFPSANNGWLTDSNNTDYAFGTGDFTIEFWIYSKNAAVDSFYRRFLTTGPDSVTSVEIGHIINVTGVVIYYTNTTKITGTTNILNAWHHVALTRQSGTVRLFIDGIQEGGDQTDTDNKTNDDLSVGTYNGNNSGRTDGQMQDLRIYKGVAKYTTNFTPSPALPGVVNCG
jgi:hypothetical protein